MTARMVHDLADLHLGDLGYFGESPCSWKVVSQQTDRIYLRHENGMATMSLTLSEAQDQNWLWWRETL